MSMTLSPIVCQIVEFRTPLFCRYEEKDYNLAKYQYNEDTLRPFGMAEWVPVELGTVPEGAVSSASNSSTTDAEYTFLLFPTKINNCLPFSRSLHLHQ